MVSSREIHLVGRPTGMPTDKCFQLVSTPVPDLKDGQILVQNTWMSVDPYMRGRMDDTESYIEPFALGEVMEGGAIGRVVESRSSDFAVGDCVESMQGWREYFVSTADASDLVRHDPDRLPWQAYLGTAGMTGLTAYAGLLLCADAQAGDTVFVSGAAGAVGSAACQIARIKGCRVVASAGSADKIRWLTDVAGVDMAFNYKEVDSVSAALKVAAPQGIDVYFENVGGEHLRAAIQHMNQYGRVAVCGMIADYNEVQTDETGLFAQILTKSLLVKGFIVLDFVPQFEMMRKQLAEWILSGELKSEESVYDGIENAPAAFMGLFEGRNIGKMLVKLAD